MRVLVIAGSALSSLAIVRSLARKGITTLTADVIKTTAAGWSRYSSKSLVYAAPSYSEPKQEKFVESVLTLAKENGIDIIFPVNDPTVVPISRYLDKFTGSGIKVPIPPFETLEFGFDKSKTRDLATRLGIPQPRTILLSDFNIVDDEPTFPCVIKNRSEATGGVSVKYFNNRDDLNKFIATVTNKAGYLIQEYIPGRAKVYSVATVYDRGKLKAALTLRKIRENPPSGGVAVYGETVHEPEIQELGTKLLTALKWHGTATVELKLDPRDNTPKLMEINPRFFGYVQLAIAAGVDIPYLLYQIAVGEEVTPVTEYKVDVTWMRPDDDLFGLVLSTREARSWSQRWQLVKSFLKSYPKSYKNSEYLKISDPLPLFSQIAYHYVLLPIRRRFPRSRNG